jgi:hypothetical protein
MENNFADVERNMKKSLLTIFAFLMLCTSAAAGWSQDGVPLQTIEHGTINGGIYIGGGLVYM